MKYPKNQTPECLAPENTPYRGFSDSAFRPLGNLVLLSLVWGFGYLGICAAAPIPAREITVLQQEWAAATQRRLAEQETLPHSLLPPGIARQGVPVGVYYEWLKRIRLGFSTEGGKK